MSELPLGMQMPEMKPRVTRPSATLTISRDGPNGIEILLGHRAETMPAFPGYWAFPGGGLSRVDKQALEQLDNFGGDSDDGDDAARLAILREMVEELGYDWDGHKLSRVDDETRSTVVEDKVNWLPAVEAGAIAASPENLQVISRRTTPPFGQMLFENTFLHLHAGAYDEIPEADLEPQTEFHEAWWARHVKLLKHGKHIASRLHLLLFHC